jgi:polyhydroxybutyrate depolymerase
MRPLLLLALLGVVACGDADDDLFAPSPSSGAGAAGGGSDAAGATGSGGADAGPRSPSAGPGGAGSGAGGAASGCQGEALEAGDHHVPLTHAGVDRSYVLHVPIGYRAGAATPLVLNFHGFGSNPIDQAAFSQMSATADAHGFVVAYPTGLSTSWNGGICCGAAAVALTDDVGFARAVVADVSSRLCIDDKRVYSTGMSNGGYLSHRNGCESADLFAAIAPVAGVIGIPQQQCQPSRPMPVIHFYGTADALVPYAGGGALGSPSVADTDAGWATRNGCTGAPVKTYQQGLVHCETHETCEAGARVTLCTVEAGGHCWPGQASCPFGPSTTDISANEAMWEFFQGFSLP